MFLSASATTNFLSLRGRVTVTLRVGNRFMEVGGMVKVGLERTQARAQEQVSHVRT